MEALRRFRPDFIVAPSGFDGGVFDPLGRMSRTIPMGLVAAAGQAADDLNLRAKYKDLHKSRLRRDLPHRRPEP